MTKKLIIISLSMILNANAEKSINIGLNTDGIINKCFIEEQNENYPRIKCTINDQLVFNESYPDATDIYDIETSPKGFYINIGDQFSSSKIEVFSEDGKWLVGDITFTHADKDIDSKTSTCAKRLNIPYSTYLEHQFDDVIVSVDDSCISKFNVERSFDEIYNHLNPDVDNGDYPSDPEYFADRDRYIAYLTKYPITDQNEQQYTKMAFWLFKYGLYNEAILLSVNLNQFNPKSIDSILILHNCYAKLQEDEKAKQYKEKAKKLAKELGIPLSKINNSL